MNPTDRQVEFRELLGRLLGEHAAIVGPEFDGQDEGSPAEMPVPTRWLLITEWADAADGNNGPYVILANSGLSWVDQLGLVHAARTMVESD